MRTRNINSAYLLFTLFLLLSFPVYFCGCKENYAAVSQISSEETGNTINEKNKQSIEQREKILTDGNIVLSRKQLTAYGQITDCSLQSDKKNLSLTLTLPDIPRSDDSLIYLFAFEPYESYEDLENFMRLPVASAEKSTNCIFKWVYRRNQLFCQFVPALLLDGEYVPISVSSYINNPEMAAGNTTPYPKASSKKGLLLDPEMLETPLLTDLNVQHAIYNIPVSLIMGESTDNNFPTIYYGFKGNTYKFNGAVINGYDYLFSYLSNSGMITTAIVLNDWTEDYPEMIHPLSAKKKKGAYYYAFNTAEEEGCLHLEAIASFLTERYSGNGRGLVSNWIVANEINQHKVWNYMDTNDINFYAAEFEKALRIFYNAAKSNYSEAKVYFSIDHDWNDSKSNDKFFNGKELIEAVNYAACQKGSYDWGLAIHPYPDPMTRVNYWTETYDKTMEAPTLTLMNLKTVTDFLSQEEYLDRNGNVRSITVTELGFTSASGEKLQAAAFAYCYLIIDANPYIEAFIMNRQTDALAEIEQGLAFGIYELDHTPKYILDVFKYIDTDKADEYIDFMLKILRADSLEEVLSWAQ